MTRADCYRELEIGPDATTEQIRQAWRDLAQVWHPDRFGDNERLRGKAQERLKRINEAYQALSRGRLEPESTPRPPGYDPAQYQTRAPSPDPLEVLAEGVAAWYLWRKKYTDITPRLPGVRLKGRALEGLDLRECLLTGADLSGADLYKANLSQADLSRALLVEADLHRSVMLETVLTGADLSRADLASADLRGARFNHAQLQGARMVGARLEGADLRDAVGLTLRQLEVCEIDDATQLPVRLA